jgi:hypothetical protein
MATKKMNELTELTEVASDDLVMVFDASEAGSEKTKKYPVQSLKSDLTSMDPSAFGNWVKAGEKTGSFTQFATYDVGINDASSEKEIMFKASITNTASATDLLLVIGDGDGMDYEHSNYDTTASVSFARQLLENFNGSFELVGRWVPSTKTFRLTGTSYASSTDNIDISIKYTGSTDCTRVILQSYRSGSVSLTGTMELFSWQEVKPIELHSYELVKEYNLNNSDIDDTISWDGEADPECIIKSDLSDGYLSLTLNNDSGANYAQGSITQDGTSITASSNTALNAMYIGGSGSAAGEKLELNLKNHGHVRTGIKTFSRYWSSNEDSLVNIYGYHWRNTADDVTSIRLNSDSSTPTGNIRVYKLAKTHLFNQTIYNNTTLNVATTGSDTTGDGTSQKPFATINGALYWLKNKTINSDVAVTIQVADGTYNNQSLINFTHPSKNISIKGNTTTPSNVTLNFVTGSYGFSAGRNTYTAMQGFKLVGYDKSEWRTGMRADYGAVIHVTDCVLDEWGVGAQGSYGGMVNLINNYTLNNCNYGANGYAGGFAYLYSGTVSNCNVGVVANEGGRVHHTANVSFSGNNSNTYTATGGTITNG